MADSLRALIAAAFAVLVIPTVAAAQSDGPPVFSVAAGAGIAFPFHSDFSSNPFAWHVGARVRTGSHVLLEGVYEQWRDTTTFVAEDVTFRNAAGMAVGHADEVRSEDATTVSNLGLNILATGAAGRARFSGGGGPGLLTYRNHYELSLKSCIADLPQACMDTVQRDSRSSFSVQGAVELDVTIAPWLSAFARAGMAVPVEDPGSGFASAGGGVRFNLRR